MSRRKRKKSIGNMFQMSDPDKYEDIQRQKLQMQKESTNKQSSIHWSGMRQYIRDYTNISYNTATCLYN